MGNDVFFALSACWKFPYEDGKHFDDGKGKIATKAIITHPYAKITSWAQLRTSGNLENERLNYRGDGMILHFKFNFAAHLGLTHVIHFMNRSYICQNSSP